MRPTVPAQHKEGASPRELAEFTRQVRAALNDVSLYSAAKKTPGDGVAVVILETEALAALERANVFAYVVGTTDSGAAYATFWREAQFLRPATGAGVQLGSTVDATAPRRSNVAIDCTITIADSKVTVKVNDGSQGAFSWKAWVEVRSL